MLDLKHIYFRPPVAFTPVIVRRVDGRLCPTELCSTSATFLMLCKQLWLAIHLIFSVTETDLLSFPPLVCGQIIEWVGMGKAE